MGIDILGVHILGIDILGIDIVAPTPFLFALGLVFNYQYIFKAIATHETHFQWVA